MTKLSGTIKATRVGGGRRIGFGTNSASSATDQRGLLIGALGSDLNGADLLIVAADADDSKALKKVDKGGAPLGVEPPSLTADGARQAQEAGADFVVYQLATAQADALLSEKLEYVLRLADGTPSEADLRAIASLHPTLVVAADAAEPLAVSASLELRKIALGVAAPLAVGVSADASAGQLQALREAGVVVLLLSKPTTDQVGSLRERIAELPRSSRRKGEDVTPMIPGLGASEEEEDDFDDD